MTGNPGSSPNSFGGQWTIEKLDILKRYLDAYTTALKNQPFRLVYVDAFAGDGEINLRSVEDSGVEEFIEGSARLAIDIDDKPFDRLIFVEKDRERFERLSALRREFPQRDIRPVNLDARSFLERPNIDWKDWRGVLFLDPFATEVEWKTIEKVESFNALDTWILFPLSAIARILPTSKNPDHVSTKWADKLTLIFGDERWRDLYHANPQLSLLGDEQVQRDPGVEGIKRIYKDKLKELFGQRYMEESKAFLNSRNVQIFEFIFCVGNPRGIGPAKRIAQHILRASG